MAKTRQFPVLRRIVGNCLKLLRFEPVRRFIRRHRVIILTVGPGAGLRFCQAHSTENHGAGENELPVQEALARVLHEGGVFYDIGANVGYLTIVGAKLVGSRGGVHAFEPVPDNVTALRRNIALNRFTHVRVVEQAVSSDVGRQKLVLASDPGGAALSVADRPPDAAGDLDVEVTTLDHYIQRADVSPPTVVKIDVEGAELNVLQGMSSTLERYRPAIILEVDGSNQERAEAKARACSALLTPRGYLIERLRDSYPGNRWRVVHLLAIWGGASGDHHAARA